MIHGGSKIFYDHVLIWANVRRATRQRDIIDRAIHQFVCYECGRVCLTNANLFSHGMIHISRDLTIYGKY